jgi:hypothetical protein
VIVVSLISFASCSLLGYTSRFLSHRRRLTSVCPGCRCHQHPPLRLRQITAAVGAMAHLSMEGVARAKSSHYLSLIVGLSPSHVTTVISSIPTLIKSPHHLAANCRNQGLPHHLYLANRPAPQNLRASRAKAGTNS